MTRITTFLGLLLSLVFLSTMTVAQSYRVQPGDTLAIEVIEDSSLNRTVLVTPDGRISLPGAGVLRVSGRTIEQIQAVLAERLSPNFVSPPNVFVGVSALAPEDEDPPVRRIYVVGEATNTGLIEVVPGATLMHAIAQFGGFTNFAATKRIQLRRGSEIFAIDYEQILNGSSNNGAIVLRQGDVIVVPQRKLFE